MRSLLLVVATASLFVSSAAVAQPTGSRVAQPRQPSGPPPAAARRPPNPSGVVSPRAVGRPAPTPAPIGGLRTRPLDVPPPRGDWDRSRDYGRDRDWRDRDFRDRDPRDRDWRLRDRRERDQRDRDFRDRDLRGRDSRGRFPGRPGVGIGYGYGYQYGYGYGIIDAPLPRGGVIYNGPDVNRRLPSQTWFPTIDRPRWRVDSSLTPVQAWRDLIVSDVVCDAYGTCVEREQRVRAPWVPVCRCYILTDALGRRWEIPEN